MLWGRLWEDWLGGERGGSLSYIQDYQKDIGLWSFRQLGACFQFSDLISELSGLWEP